MIHKCKKFYQKYREVLTYLFFGATTTLINWCVYICLTKLGCVTVMSNSIAWLSGVIYAFITNKLYVFQSKSMDKSTILREELFFLCARMFSGLIIEVFGLELLISLGMDQSVFGVKGVAAKLTVCVLSGISNYVFSKLVVFKKGKTQAIQDC